MTIHDVVQKILKKSTPTVFCLQEVSIDMMKSFDDFEKEYKKLGYTWDKLNHNTKTQGIILYKIV